MSLPPVPPARLESLYRAASDRMESMRSARLGFYNGKTPSQSAHSLEDQVSQMMRSKRTKKFKKMLSDKLGDSRTPPRADVVEVQQRDSERPRMESPRGKPEEEGFADEQSPTLTALKKLTRNMDIWQELGATKSLELSPPRSSLKGKRLDKSFEHALDREEGFSESLQVSALPREGSTMHTWKLLSDAEKIDFYIDCPDGVRLHLDQQISLQEFVFLLSLSLSSNQSRKSRFFVRILRPHTRAEAMNGLELSETRKAFQMLSSQEKEETFVYMGTEQIASILAETSSADTYKLFELVERHKRADVLSQLPLSCQRDILDMAPMKYRSLLVSELAVQDAIALLTSYPAKAALSLLKQFAARRQEDIMVELPADCRSQILLVMSEREIQQLVEQLPQASQVALMSDLSWDAVCQVFHVLRPATLGPLLSELNYHRHSEAVQKLSAAKRTALLQHLPESLKVEVTRTFDKREFLSLVKVLDRPILVQALQDMELYDQIEICTQIPDPLRTELVLELDAEKRLALLSALDPQDKVSILKSVDKRAFGNTFNQLQRAYDADVLSAMNAVELAELICGLSRFDQESVLRLLKVEQLRLVVMEMSIDDCIAVMPLIARPVRCQVLSLLPDGVRSLVFRELIFRQQGSALKSSHAGYDLDALALLVSLGTEVAYSTLREMDDADRLGILSKLSTTDRTALLQRMDPIERADMLDHLTLEDSATSLRVMTTEKAVEGLLEMAPNKRAILLVALPEKERVAIVEAIPADEASNILSSLPLPDTVAILKHLSPTTSVNCFLNMTTEECVVVLEAMPAKQRAEVLACMESEDSVRMLREMNARKVVETLQHVHDNDLSLMLYELPTSLLLEVIQLSSLRLRTRVVRSLSGAARASVLNELEDDKLLSLLKGLTPDDLALCFSELTSDTQLQVAHNVPARDARRLLGSLPASSRIPLLARMKLETCSQILKGEKKETIEGILRQLTGERRRELLHELPEGLRTAINDSLAASELAQAAHDPSPPRPAQLVPAVSESIAEGAVVVSLSFRHNELWAAGRRSPSFWEGWVKNVLCPAVDTSPRRVELVSLHEASASLVLRCLASSSRRLRTPLLLAQEIVSWLKEAELEDGLELMAATIHAPQGTRSWGKSSRWHDSSVASSHGDRSRTFNESLSGLKNASSHGGYEYELEHDNGLSPESFRLLQASDIEEEMEEQGERSMGRGEFSLLDKLFEPLSAEGRGKGDGWSVEESRASGGADIFESLQMLQSTIQRRNQDIRSFTRSVRSLQHEAQAERLRARDRDKSGDFIYA